MVKKFLKIAGVKNEQEFYKKYPSESAFFKAHPEAKDLKMYKKGGEMKKLKQLTSYEGDIDGIVPQFQNAPYPILPGNQVNETSGISFGTPVGLTPQAAQANANMQNMLWGTSGSITQAPVVGGTVPQQIKGMNMNVPVGKQKFDLLGKMGGPQGIINTAGSLIGGIQELQAEKKARKDAERQARVSDVVLQAAKSRPKEVIKRQYNRPEDVVINPDELYPPFGTGTEVLASAQDGISMNQIGGNPSEIQNVYNPGTIYSDMGYEPMNDSDQVKQFAHGGMRRAQFGITSSNIGAVSNVAGSLGGYIGGNNAGSNIGGTLGSTVGSIFGGPIGGAVGNFLGSAIGGALDPNQRKMKAANERMRRNSELAGFYSGMQSIQGPYSNIMRDGGSVNSDYEWISHTWQPQVITKFGDVDVSDIHSIATEGMDTLRTGGNIRQNYTYPQDQFAFGGELQTTWGGKADPMSHNPYLPNTGQTVMFRGNSHEQADGKGRTGIGVKYGNGGEYDPYMEYGKNGVEDVTDVEVEKGEPAMELKDPQSGENNMVVFGNLKINKDSAKHIGDPKANGKKFKHYIKDLSLQEQKLNSVMNKSSDKMSELEPYTPFDTLSMNSYNANMKGADMKLKDIAKKKNNASIVQNAINETAEEHGLDADAFAQGKFKRSKEATQQAKWGKNVPKAQDGKTLKEKFEKTRAEALEKLQALYPGKKVDLEPRSEFRHLKDQRGIHASGSSKTDISIHNFDAAKDYVIVVDGKEVHDPNVYSKTLHAAAKNNGLEHLNWKEDPYHVSAVKEGKGHTFKKLFEKYPELKNTEQYKESMDYLEGLASKNQMTQQEIDAYKDITGKDVSGFKPFTYDAKAAAAEVGNVEHEYIKPKTPETPQVPPPDIEIPEKPKTTIPTTTAPVPIVPGKKKFDWWKGLNALTPYLYRGYEGGMPDLYPEQMALAMNPLEAVKAQGIQPLLRTPYDISLQDQLNEVTASSRAAQRMAGGDPSALANIAAGESAAKQKILGEQFRLNQAEREGVYSDNRKTLMDTQLRNLGIYADQQEKQERAKAITKATALEAISSMSDKIAKRKLEDKTIRLYENMFPNYRLTASGRMVPRGLTFFNTPDLGVGSVGGVSTTGAQTTSRGSGEIPDNTNVTPGTGGGGTTQVTPIQMDNIADSYRQMQNYMWGSGGDVSSGPSIGGSVPSEVPLPKKKAGGKTSKKDARNSSIVKALKLI